MARGPFQGTWRDGVRPTVVTAPDALVYVNGRPEILACTNCRRSFDLNKYITSLQVDLNVNNAPGSANFSLSIPRHSIDDFIIDGEPVLTPMMEVEMYAKGYYLVNGMPQYYPIFWGMITDVSHSYSGGEETFNVSCADILKWWELCRMNINPAFTQAAGQVGRHYVSGNAFDGCNVYDIIWTLAQQSFGDVVQAKGSLTSVTKEASSPALFGNLRKDIMSYWNARFGQMRSSLLLYGVRGAGVRGDAIYSSQPTATSQTSQKVASTAVRNANGGANSGSQILFDPINDVIPFRSNISNTGSPNLWESEFQTKLELANTCKEAVGFEFFMDVTGDIVFKPPFYNLDVLSNKPVSWIQDIDIIDWDFGESESEVITHLQVQGSFDGGSMDHGVTSDFNTPFAQVIDYHLLRQYGWRTQSFNAEYLSTQEARFYAGLDMLDRINSRRHRATINIPLRPELRLGFPVYVAPKDQIWYLSGISHNIQFGGRAQTTLTLTAKRSKFIAPKGIGTIELSKFERGSDVKRKKATSTAETSTPLVNNLKPSAKELSRTGHFKLKVGDAAETPPTNLAANGTTGEDPYAPLLLRHPKTGRLVGYPNVNMAYTRPFKPTSDESKVVAGENVSTKRKAPKTRGREDSKAAQTNRDLVMSGLVQNEERDLVDKHLNNRYTYGMTSAGVYTYVHDLSKTLQEIVQLPIANIDVSSAGTKLAASNGTATIRPVSDERGFEVVGHFRYGRGISLRDGSLVLTNAGLEQASIDTQLALSGGLFESLTAQSRGLTSLTSSYANPADAVARLTLDDQQTAATVNPAMGRAEFTTTGVNFVESAPLNSSASRGEFATAEASQLSRARTIAEMRVKDVAAVPNEDCACLLGRADLAFINVGYQVKFLKGTQPDNSGGVLGPLRRSRAELDRLENTVIPRLERAIVEAEANLRVLRSPDTDSAASEAVSTLESLLNRDRLALQRAQEQAESLQLSIEDMTSEQTSEEGNFVGDAFLNGTDSFSMPIAEASRPTTPNLTLTQVEQFLADLYETMDGPHQQFEDALRGKLIEGPTREGIVSGTFAPPEQFSPFSPPFSAAGRARGGDPEALALQGSTARSDLTSSWKEFGENLQKGPKMTEVQETIGNLEGRLNALDREEERLTAAQESGSIVLSPDGSVRSRLASLREERTQATRELDNARAKLRQLEAS